MGLDSTHWSVPEPPVRAVRGYLIWPAELPDYVARWLGLKTDAAVHGGIEAGGGGFRDGVPPHPATTDEQGGRP